MDFGKALGLDLSRNENEIREKLQIMETRDDLGFHQKV